MPDAPPSPSPSPIPLTITLPWIDPLAHPRLLRCEAVLSVPPHTVRAGHPRSAWLPFLQRYVAQGGNPKALDHAVSLAMLPAVPPDRTTVGAIPWAPVMPEQLAAWNSIRADLDAIPYHPETAPAMREAWRRTSTPLRVVRLEIADDEDADNFRRVAQHSAKPTQNFCAEGPYQRLNIRQEASSRYYLGFELEMENRYGNTSSRRTLCEAIWTAMDGFQFSQGSDTELLHIEEDGSLPSTAIEVPTMPGDPSSPVVRRWWRHLWRSIHKAGAHNHSGRCGMHIHVSRTAWKQMRALNPSEAEFTSLNSSAQAAAVTITDFLTALLMGRPGSIAFPTTGFHPCAHAFGRHIRWDGGYARPMPSRRTFNNSAQRNLERYRHLNHQNSHTIEFRAFGPYNYDDPTGDWLNVCADLIDVIISISQGLAVNILNVAAGLRRVPAAPSDWPPEAQEAFGHIYSLVQRSLPRNDLGSLGIPVGGLPSSSELRAMLLPEFTQHNLGAAWRLVMAVIAEKAPRYDHAYQHLCAVKAPGHSIFCTEGSCRA